MYTLSGNMIVLWYVLDVCHIIIYVGVKASINCICQAAHLKLHSEMILLKVNQVVTRKDICISKVSFHYAILVMMLVSGMDAYIYRVYNFL